MASPQSLLEMAGAPLEPSAWDKAALVLIDAQMEYVDGKLPLPGVKAALDEAARVLRLARRQGAPVIHVVHHGRPGGALFDPNGIHAKIAPEVAPETSEPIIVKGLPNAFARTDLQKTVDATATRDLPDPLMCPEAHGVQKAETVHRATLAALADRFAIVVRNARAWT